MASESKASGDVPADAGKEAELIKVTREAKECNVSSVTVFSDRAEITRQLTFTAEAGPHEVVIEGLTKFVNTESVRVKGTGHFSILEVSFGVHTKVDPPASEESKDEVAKLKTEAEELVKASTALEQQRDVLLKEKALLDKYAESVLSPPTARSSEAAPAPLTDLKFVEDLLTLRATRTAATNGKLNEIEEKSTETQLKLSAVRSRLQELGRSSRRGTTKSNDVTVALNVVKAGEVSLQLTYQVSNASWSPSYDVRISSTDNHMELTYHGLVQQNTGEDWTNAKVVLSTATPSVGGSAPVLPTKTASFYGPRVAVAESMPRRQLERRHMHRGGARTFARNRQAMAFDMEADRLSMEESDDEELEVEAKVATSKVEGGGAAATFAIERPATIDSDNKPHKVTVAILKLKSNFRHYSVPALSPEAYLQAETKNTSEYPLLASKKVSVFLDGSFVSTTILDNVSPGESFRNFLGVDRAVRVTYKPQAAVRSSKGMFTKSASVTYKFETLIKNTKAQPARVVVADMLPRSTDERIKVKLVSPTQEQVEGGDGKEDDGGAISAAGAGSSSVTQVKATNNIVWSRDVAAGESATITYEYAIEHPPEQTISIN